MDDGALSTNSSSNGIAIAWCPFLYADMPLTKNESRASSCNSAAWLLCFCAVSPCRMSANASAVFITNIMTKGWKGPFTGSAPRSDLVVLTGIILAGHQAESVRADVRRICNHPLLPPRHPDLRLSLQQTTGCLSEAACWRAGVIPKAARVAPPALTKLRRVQTASMGFIFQIRLRRESIDSSRSITRVQENFACPGMATSGNGVAPHSNFGGAKFSCELIACSQVIDWPV